jgi:hypothetical protein
MDTKTILIILGAVAALVGLGYGVQYLCRRAIIQKIANDCGMTLEEASDAFDKAVRGEYVA